MTLPTTSNTDSAGPGPPVVITGSFNAAMTPSEFYQFCLANPQLRIERTADGELIVMPPTGGETGRRSFSLAKQLGNWCDRDGTGIAFDSSTGFWLPNRAERSPDAAWVRLERWNSLSQKERDEFPPLAPDFVIELRSKSDRPQQLRAKMQEYIANGVRLAWLIDPETRQVEIYRAGQSPVVLDQPASVSGDPELPGFVLDLTAIW